MWVLILSLVAIAFIAFLSGYIRNAYLRRKVMRGELDRMPEVKEVDVECCGRHDVCERDHVLAAAGKAVEYYDDEELDKYAGTASDGYTAEQIGQFREIFYTMQENDIAGWVRSLQRRGISLPDEIKDEVFLVIGENAKP